MYNLTQSIWATRRNPPRLVDDEKNTGIPTHQYNESGVCMEENRSAQSLFAGGTCARFVKFASGVLAMSIVLLSFVNFLAPCFEVSTFSTLSLSVRSAPLHARALATSFLEDFQVYPPVLTAPPNGGLEITDGSSTATVEVVNSHRQICQEVLAVHSFAFSFGEPFVGEYHPPSCSFNRVTWNLTFVSAGRQFDRLGIVYLGDIEVFRTSTAEPTANGIEWTYLKDMTNFLSLFKQDQKLIFDLGNEITDVLTGSFNVTLTAAFFNAEDSITPADLIMPVSGRKASQNMPSVFTLPPDTASNDLTLPRNVKKAVFTIAATGQMFEEFWWSNVLNSDVTTFNTSDGAGILFGFSPFREVQLFIDGMLAGVAWPFPIIFTGGVVPGLWRPIVGIDAFDLKEDEIDITPWLPLLCDGKSHSFTIRISGLNETGDGTAVLAETTETFWLVTGKVFMWLDEEGHVTTGDGPVKMTPTPRFEVSSSVGKNKKGENETLTYSVRAQRNLSFQSTLNLSHGKETAIWRQSLTFSNEGNFTNKGFDQTNNQQTDGFDSSSSGYAKQISYPLFALMEFVTLRDNITIVATVNRGKMVKTIGQPVFPTGLESFSAATDIQPRFPQFQGASLATTQNGQATFQENQTSSASSGFGTTEQDMTFSGIRVDSSHNPFSFPSISGTDELFQRHVKAVNATVVEDHETLVGRPIEHEHGHFGGGNGFAPIPFTHRGGHLHGFGQGRGL